jgi:hypothetical protein
MAAPPTHDVEAASGLPLRTLVGHHINAPAIPATSIAAAGHASHSVVRLYFVLFPYPASVHFEQLMEKCLDHLS